MATTSGMRFLTSLFSRAILAARAGLQFEGKRDLYSVYGYKKQLVTDDFLARFLRQDIAKRIVKAYPDATWRKPPKIDGGSRFNKSWEEFVKKFQVWAVLHKLDMLSGIGRFGILLMGFNDTGRLDQPVGEGNKELLYLQPYSERSTIIKTLNVDPKDPRYALPEMYEIQASAPSIFGAVGQNTGVLAAQLKAMNVHFSRIIHVAEETLEDNILGCPRLETVYNLLDDLAKVVGGSAEMYWLNTNRGTQVNVDKEMDLDADDAKALEDEMTEWQHELRRIVRTRGVEMKPLGASVTDPANVFDMLVTLVSATTGIPKRILLGSEAGQLASDQDRANWADRISVRQTTYAEPKILLPFINTMVEAGVIGKPASELKIEWEDPYSLTPLEQAQMFAQKARAAANYSKSLNNRPVLSVNEARASMALPSTGKPEDDKVPAPLVKGQTNPANPNDPAQGDNPSNGQIADPTDPNAKATDTAAGGDATSTKE